MRRGTSPVKYLKQVHSPDQRATYRVQAVGDDTLIWVGLPDGPAQAKPFDISARGCGFLLSPEQAATLEDDAEVVLRLVVGGAGMPKLVVKAKVRNRVPSEDQVRIGVQFLDPERLYTQLTQEQWLFFNRRGAFRVPPLDDRGRPLVARFYLPGKRQPKAIPIHDLSSSGMSVSLPADADVEFSETRPMRVTFTLPLDGTEVDIKVLFVHRTPIKGTRRVGFRFDPDSTPQFTSQTETILRYVLERQRQLVSAQ